MSLTTGSSEIGTSGLRTQTMGLNVGTSYLGSGGVRTSSVSSQTPYQAHVARMQSATPNSSGYYTAQDYTASSTQAGLFVDAFGGSLTYTSPNVPASPTRVVDGTSGLAYVSADGANDTAVSSTAQKVAAYTAVFRAPPGQTTWNNYGSILDSTHAANSNNGYRLGLFAQNATTYYGASSSPPSPYPVAVSRNGVDLAVPFDLAPITHWMIVAVKVADPTDTQVLSMFALENTYFLRAHLAALLLWPTLPSAAEMQAAKQEMQNYYGPLIATNPS